MPKRYEGSRQKLVIYTIMKKFFYVAVLALAFASCGQTKKDAANENQANEPVATDVVPAAATDVVPAAVPGPENNGQVATDVVPAGINDATEVVPGAATDVLPENVEVATGK